MCSTSTRSLWLASVLSCFVAIAASSTTRNIAAFLAGGEAGAPSPPPRLRHHNHDADDNDDDLATQVGALVGGAWKHVYGKESGGVWVDESEDSWAHAMDTSPHHILLRLCYTCVETHRVMYYRRLVHGEDGDDDLNSQLMSIGSVPPDAQFFGNPRSYFRDTWSSNGNRVNVNFELFSSYEHALARVHPWQFCNYDDTGIGFPRDCGPIGYVPNQWNSVSRGGQRSYDYFIEQPAFNAITAAPTTAPPTPPPAPVCAPGTYAKNGDCAPCKKGFVSLTHGATACERCPPGTKAHRNRKKCVPASPSPSPPDAGGAQACPTASHADVRAECTKLAGTGGGWAAFVTDTAPSDQCTPVHIKTADKKPATCAAWCALHDLRCLRAQITKTHKKACKLDRVAGGGGGKNKKDRTHGDDAGDSAGCDTSAAEQVCHCGHGAPPPPSCPTPDAAGCAREWFEGRGGAASVAGPFAVRDAITCLEMPLPLPCPCTCDALWNEPGVQDVLSSIQDKLAVNAAPCPSRAPSPPPTPAPSGSPTAGPTKYPTKFPTDQPTGSPVTAPTPPPTAASAPTAATVAVTIADFEGDVCFVGDDDDYHPAVADGQELTDVVFCQTTNKDHEAVAVTPAAFALHGVVVNNAGNDVTISADGKFCRLVQHHRNLNGDTRYRVGCDLDTDADAEKFNIASLGDGQYSLQDSSGSYCEMGWGIRCRFRRAVTSYGRFSITSRTIGPQAYGSYVAVTRFDQPVFWPQHAQMGYAYYQRTFGSFADMLDWSAGHGVDWGWKEGDGQYGQLFYHQWWYEDSPTPLFGGSIELWNEPVDFSSNVPAGSTRIGFVKKELLLHHPSWRDTAARAAYVAAIGFVDDDGDGDGDYGVDGYGDEYRIDGYGADDDEYHIAGYGADNTLDDGYGVDGYGDTDGDASPGYGIDGYGETDGDDAGDYDYE